MSIRFCLATLCSALLINPALSDDHCPKDFENYGIFLQAKKACGRDIEYPFMSIMKACAKETPEAKAVELINNGRRLWVMKVMQSSLGTVCHEVISNLPVITPLKR